MGLFDGGYKAKFWQLVNAIDERYKLYEMLNSGNPNNVPPGLQTLLQEYKNLKIRAWSIEKNDSVAQLIKDLKQEELQQQIDEKGDLP